MNKIHLTILVLFLLLTFHSPSTAEENDTFIYGGLAWSPDGALIAVGTNKGVNLHRGEDLTFIAWLYDQAFVTSLDWHPNGELLASSDSTGQIIIWNLMTNEAICTIQASIGLIGSVKWNSDGSLLAGRAGDRALRFWDTQTCQVISTINTQVQVKLDAITWHPTQNKLASFAPYGGDLTIWNVVTGESIRNWDLVRETATISWSPDSSTIAAGGWHHVTLWNAANGEMLDTFELDDTYTFALAWSPDSRYFAYNLRTNDLGGYIHIRERETGDLVAELDGGLMTGDSHYANALSWHPAGNLLASTNDYGRIELWDTQTYELIASYRAYKSLVLTD